MVVTAHRPAHVAPRSFIRRFKAATGHAPVAYVQSLRMSAAKKLLENDSIPMATVSSKVGYSDLAFLDVFSSDTPD
ncbi:helix-turn-helix domain-containing protein [Paraburkholderia silvatlantica]|uniref:helix-turn-helix domain-containing protein n=1 Tax=Paraburkholderia silvatlantica TaxID=321895 RepID=UPI001AD7F12A